MASIRLKGNQNNPFNCIVMFFNNENAISVGVCNITKSLLNNTGGHFQNNNHKITPNLINLREIIELVLIGRMSKSRVVPPLNQEHVDFVVLKIRVKINLSSN